MARSKTEIKALTNLLEQDWEEIEDLAKALIDKLDSVRAASTTYVGVLQFGQRSPFYAGIGPYPGRKSAENALSGHPAAGDATARAVVPLTTKDGLAALLEEVDTMPTREHKETAKSKKEANQKFAQLMSKERTHIKADKGGVQILKVERSRR